MDYEAEYNNRARVPEHPRIMAGWASDAAAYRRQVRCNLGLAYGESVRSTVDLFWPAAPRDDAPIAMFIHGGYWQALDGGWFSHIARGVNAHGIAMAVPTYDLCPGTSIAAIVEQIRTCCEWLWRRFERRLVVCGHSCGGHLTAAMLATDWTEARPGLPGDLTAVGLSISGLFELEPLVHTSINDKLGLTPTSARAVSPLFWTPRAKRLVAVVGGAESSEYLRQSRTITETWREAGVDTHYVELAGENHFTVIASLAEPQGPLTRILIELAESAQDG